MNKKLKRGIIIFISSWLLITLIWFGFDLDGKYDWSIGTKRVEIPTEDSSTWVDSSELTVEKAEILYGINADSFQKVEGVVLRNQFLHNILNPHGVSPLELDYIGRKLRDTFDVRRMRAGRKYTLLLNEDSAKEAAYFIYEIDNTDYVVYDLRDSVRAYRGKKPIETLERTTSGVINNSLYVSLEEQNASPTLAIELSEVYAWAVDFYRIQIGDYYKVIYEEQFVDGKSIGVSKIKAALFNHYNQDYYAVWFEKGEQEGDYFDQDNNSCRRAFLKSPVKFSRISSRYTLRRFHPVQKRWKAHLGTDYAAPRGTPISATGNGTVIAAYYSRYNGNFVKIRHNSVYTTQYLHMSKIASGIRKGVRVQQGQTIGYVGSTGLATGPHVCYRFWKNGKQVDALRVKIPPSKPVEKEYLEDYKKVKNFYMAELAKIELPQKDRLASMGQ